MIIRKSAREIELMRIAGRIVALAHQEVQKHIAPGVSTLELDKIAEDVIRKNGATPSFKGYNGFHGSICASINEVVVHGIPKASTILKRGDIISVDIGACYKGYHGDSAQTYPVGDINKEDEKLLDITLKALYKGLEQAKPNNRLGDISAAIGDYATNFGYGVVVDFTGHGVGRKLHEDPVIPNYGIPNTGPILQPGMTLAIEPMINAGTRYVKTCSDGWTTITRDKKRSAHFEHTILITDTGYEILTKV